VTITTHPHEVQRLAIAVGSGFDDFRDAPLRTMIHEDTNGTAWFSVDQPSTRFSSFGDPAITEVGLELDHELAALLEHLGVPVPPTLTREPGLTNGGAQRSGAAPRAAHDDHGSQGAAPR
jgi:hypothetical protein